MTSLSDITPVYLRGPQTNPAVGAMPTMLLIDSYTKTIPYLLIGFQFCVNLPGSGHPITTSNPAMAMLVLDNNAATFVLNQDTTVANVKQWSAPRPIATIVCGYYADFSKSYTVSQSASLPVPIMMPANRPIGLYFRPNILAYGQVSAILYTIDPP